MNGKRYTMLTLIKKKKVGVAILISERTDFKARKVIRDKEGHFDPPRRHTIFNMHVP